MTQLKAFIIPVTPFQQNCSLVYDEAKKVGAIVDPGGDVPVILEAIKQSGVTDREDPAHPRPYRPCRRCGGA